MVPTWGPPGSCQPQMGPMLVPWTLLSGRVTVGTHCQCHGTHKDHGPLVPGTHKDLNNFESMLVLGWKLAVFKWDFLCFIIRVQESRYRCHIGKMQEISRNDNIDFIPVWYQHIVPDSKVHVANMGPTWVLSAPDGPMLAPTTLLLGVCSRK